ncbi:MAG TPA: PrgI family protein [Candidatus Dormibacteraeota bacterium]|nr:PrgI family protein [Candidatus Dormibacteraeota bacterium]
MAQYKVPQNVEAEDKILGPLTLKQFIYALIGIGYGFLTFAIFQGTLLPLFFIVGLPPALLMLALGLYQKDDQPLEAYFLAMVNFIVKPKQRFWQKEPIAEVFRLEVPAPKPHEPKKDITKLAGQLEKLGQIVDTRGWSTKQPEIQEPEEEQVIDLRDRLGMTQTGVGTPVPDPVEVQQADDILDTKNNPNSASINVLIENTVKSVREEALVKMQQAVKQPTKNPIAASTSGMTATPPVGILKLASEAGDLTVAQLSAQAKRHNQLLEGKAVSLRNGKPSAS